MYLFSPPSAPGFIFNTKHKLQRMEVKVWSKETQDLWSEHQIRKQNENYSGACRVVISETRHISWDLIILECKPYVSHIRNMDFALREMESFKLEWMNEAFKRLLATEKAMAPHSSILAWQIPWMEEPGRLQSMGSLGVWHNWATSLSLFTFMHWRRKWQPTPVFLPGESQGQGSLVGCRLWGRTELDMTEAA